MKNYNQLTEELNAETEIAKAKKSAELKEEEVKRLEKLNNFVNAVFDKYSDILEADLKTYGCTCLVFGDDPYTYKFKYDHVITIGDLNAYDVVCKARQKFIELGYRWVDFGKDYVFIKIPNK